MSKLYPPYIDGKLPAQAGGELIIPFRLNRAVNINEVTNVIAKIKTLTSNNILGNQVTVSKDNILEVNKQNNEYQVKFDIKLFTDSKDENGNDIQLFEFAPGQFYKIQLAFQGGYFSSIGVFKYTTKPEITMPGLSEDTLTGNLYTYVGQYSQQNGDRSEKVYSYEFVVCNESMGNQIVDGSGVKIHDSSQDEAGDASIDTFTLSKELNIEDFYYIQYKVTTNNGLKVSSAKYPIGSSVSYPNPIKNAKFIAENDYDNARIILKLKNLNTLTYDTKVGYVITRSSAQSNYKVWEDLLKFTLTPRSPMPEEIGTDMTTEQGQTYKYGLQFYQQSGLRTERIESNIVLSDFEDMFLFDGKRQLRIKFNPKVTSFKTTLLETKIDTLGGQYPFFFRNGNVSYKEFPLSGLISYLSDENEYFISNEELGFGRGDEIYRTETPHYSEDDKQFNYSNQMIAAARRSTNLDGQNFYAERAFKMAVLDWLNDSKPKLFRSPAEGNLIVRLMNVSFSPSEQLGRMLHTFSATAYEVADISYTNLIKYGFLSEQVYDNQMLVFGQYNLASAFGDKTTIYFGEQGAHMAEIIEEKPNTIFYLKFQDGQAPIRIQIGATGTYKINIYDHPLMYISYDKLTKPTGKLNFAVYEEGPPTDFTSVQSITYNREQMQFVGQNKDIITTPAFDGINDLLGYVYTLNIYTRELAVVYQNNDKYYTDPEFQDPAYFLFDTLYSVANSSIIIDGNDPSHPLPKENGINYSYTITYKDDTTSSLSLEKIGEVLFHGFDNIKQIHLGNGLIAEMFCQKIHYIYK